MSRHVDRQDRSQNRQQRDGRSGTSEAAARHALPRVQQRHGHTLSENGRVVSGSPLYLPLFTPQRVFVRDMLEKLPQALNQIMPLSRTHRAGLPDAIQELSALLTFERGGLGRSYWSAPRFISAYLRYFLPWNLIRLTRLFPGLDLPDPSLKEKEEGLPCIVDLGSGPLTLPIALWLARPDWRKIPLELICVDTVPRPMELGRTLLEQLASLSGEELRWQIRLVRSPLLRFFRELRHRPLLVMAGNVLNELKDRTGSLDERMAELSMVLSQSLDVDGRALFIEPGTRLGGTLTTTLREAALEDGMKPLAPCPHSGPCPMLERGNRRWCHFVQEAEAPVWLAELARQAGLPKSSLSLSFVLLRLAEDLQPAYPFPDRQERDLAARVISDAFFVPGMGTARYACSVNGLSILPVAGEIPSGALTACRRPDVPSKDTKSGAVVLNWRPRSQKQ